MIKIEKKVWLEYFQELLDGIKTFELRLANFECKPGDMLILREWNPKTRQYTGRVLEKAVTYVFKTKEQKFWPEKDIEKHGFQVIAFK